MDREIYIVEEGCYEQRTIAGVYDSVELAMGAYPDDRWTLTYFCHHLDYSLEEHNRLGPAYDPGRRLYYENWTNDKDWGDARSIYAYDLVTQGPCSTPSTIVEQRYRQSDGGWDYVPITAEEGKRLLNQR